MKSKWGRSVNDYANEQALHEALSHPPSLAVRNGDGESSTASYSSSSALSSSSSSSSSPPICVCIGSNDGSRQAVPVEDRNEVQGLDWYVDNVDKEQSNEQDIEHEMKRLMVLKSYMVLDELEKESRQLELDRLARLANRQFGTQMCFCSIIDLGRALFLARDNLPLDGVPRKGTFCAHALLSKEDFFEVRDCKQDQRFCDNPYVQAGTVQFYAAYNLISPEGYRLGVFAVVGNEPRPEGLNPSEIESLKDFAELAVEGLVAHRTIKNAEKQLKDARQRLAGISHDIVTPLTSVQLSISLLESDSAFQNSAPPYQKECLAMAATCAEVMAEKCDALRAGEGDRDSLPPGICVPKSPGRDVIHLPSLVGRLHTVMDTIPKQVPLAIYLAPRVPENIVGDELKIFRACLTMLTYCCDRSTVGTVRMTLRARESVKAGSVLLFEIEDCGPEIGMQEQIQIFQLPEQLDETVKEGLIANEMQPSKHAIARPGNPNHWSTLGLFSVATQVQALGGDFGVLPLSTDLQESNKASTAPTTRFWLSIPLSIPDNEMVQNDLLARSRQVASRDAAQALVASCGHKRALVVDDSTVVRKIMAKSLVRLGFDTDQAVNGMEGVEKMQKHLYDIVFLDFFMPVLDGLDCVRVFREWERRYRPLTHQRIVGISAHAIRKDVQRGLLLGMDSFQSKPLTVDVLKRIASEPASTSELATRRDLNVVEDVEPGIERPRKRSVYDANKNEKAILVATDDHSFHQVCRFAASSDWKASLARSTAEALTMLKSRNWDAVLLDSGFSDFAGISCVRDFRAWEEGHRVNRQDCIYLLDMNAPGRGVASVQELPDGIDGTIRKPVQEQDIRNLVKRVDQASFNASKIIV